MRTVPASRRRVVRTRIRRVQVAAVFTLLAFLAFAPALNAPFDFDDRPAILDNTTIRQLWPPSALWRTPPRGTAVSGSPVVNYSFALNYALNRVMAITQTPASDAAEQTVGYHVANVLLHVAAALLLFAVIRRTVRSRFVPSDWHESADWLAAIVCRHLVGSSDPDRGRRLRQPAHGAPRIGVLPRHAVRGDSCLARHSGCRKRHAGVAPHAPMVARRRAPLPRWNGQ